MMSAGGTAAAVAADPAGQAAEHDLSATPVGPGAAGGPPLAAGGFFLELAGVDITGIQGHLAQSDVPFEASQLYDSLEDAKLVDTSLRRSKFRLFRDECLFDLVASRILPEANRADPDREYSLVRNDLTHIVYREGDFVRPPKSTAAARGCRFSAPPPGSPAAPTASHRLDSSRSCSSLLPPPSAQPSAGMFS